MKQCGKEREYCECLVEVRLGLVPRHSHSLALILKKVPGDIHLPEDEIVPDTFPALL